MAVVCREGGELGRPKAVLFVLLPAEGLRRQSIKTNTPYKPELHHVDMGMSGDSWVV